MVITRDDCLWTATIMQNAPVALQPGDEQAYTAMAAAVSAAVEDLLLPFHVANADELGQARTADEFFQEFLSYADRFTENCCQHFAKVSRQASVVPEVRATPTLVMSKQIRETSFASLDSLLVGYIQALRQIGLDLSRASSQLQEGSMLGAAMRGAAVGQVAGGLGSTGKTLGVFNPHRDGIGRNRRPRFRFCGASRR